MFTFVWFIRMRPCTNIWVNDRNVISLCTWCENSCTALWCLCFSMQSFSRCHNSSWESFWHWKFSSVIRAHTSNVFRCFQPEAHWFATGPERLLSIQSPPFMTLVYRDDVRGACRGEPLECAVKYASSRQFYSGVAAGGNQPREALCREISFHALCVYRFYWGFRQEPGPPAFCPIGCWNSHFPVLHVTFALRGLGLCFLRCAEAQGFACWARSGHADGLHMHNVVRLLL